ncbi:hypothetical protein L204_104346 [Cryptococcus depauperatus]|nr:hypothetical protein L204_04824 [Cryptococcus depauperatus CBS 7855]
MVVSPSLTAIVAATIENGIGINGSLPWRLPREMKYFARVTTGSNPSSNPRDQNIVVMGRKTWESIPPKFRPLKSRRNFIISTRGVDVQETENTQVFGSLPSALSNLPTSADSSRSFLIGGSTLYNTCFTLSPNTSKPIVDRILLTRILTPFDCDTFLEDFTSHTYPNGKKVWKKSSHRELQQWIGWEEHEHLEEKGIKYKLEMWVLNEDEEIKERV